MTAVRVEAVVVKPSGGVASSRGGRGRFASAACAAGVGRGRQGSLSPGSAVVRGRVLSPELP